MKTPFDNGLKMVNLKYFGILTHIGRNINVVKKSEETEFFFVGLFWCGAKSFGNKYVIFYFFYIKNLSFNFTVNAILNTLEVNCFIQLLIIYYYTKMVLIDITCHAGCFYRFINRKSNSLLDIVTWYLIYILYIHTRTLFT